MLRSSASSVRLVFFIITFLLLAGCSQQAASAKTVLHETAWGIYSLDIATQDVELVYGSAAGLQSSALRLNQQGDRLVFSQKVGGDTDEYTEIFTIGVDGGNLQRVTDNSFWDLYPAWSPDSKSIAFLSKRDKDLDIYVMGSDGSDARKLYDSGDNDADIDWAGDKIVFTSGSSIWAMAADGTQPKKITNPSSAGKWGKANLPIGDYDPRLSPDGGKVVFERLENPDTTHGSYNMFIVNSDGTGETRLTSNGYSQGLASWSHSGDKLVYVVAAIGDQGQYDIYMINSDGTGNKDMTPGYFPPTFLCNSPIFSKDDSKVFFIGQWWE
ncbi:PD40 domain-containing protein [archaeon]|nr:PD40 domain-containing protein [archaeon]